MKNFGFGGIIQPSVDPCTKGGFFSESVIRFSNLQISKIKIFQKIYPELEIWISRLLWYTIIGGKFKFQVQDSFLEYFFWIFEKRIALSEKKPPLAVSDDYSGCWSNSFLRFFLHACPSANYVLRTKSHYAEKVCEIAHLISFFPTFSAYLVATNLHQWFNKKFQKIQQ